MEKQAKLMVRHLSKIIKKDGFVTPSHLVSTAKAENSPIHGCFEWDDGKAGEEYRLIQARHWIRTIKVEVLDREDKIVKISLAHIPTSEAKGEGVYKPISVIVESLSDFEKALNAAISDLEAAQRRVSELNEAAKAIGAVDKASVISQLAMTLVTMRDVLQRLQ